MKEKCSKFQILSGSSLKIIAIVTMLIDHIGAAILYETVHTEYGVRIYYLFRTIGRIAFPIFCFLLVEGFLHTHDVKKYALRLGVFCVISEIPFDLAFTKNGDSIWIHQNVFWTLFIAFLVMVMMNEIEIKMPFSSFQMKRTLQLACMLFGGAIAYFMRTDYDYKGVFAICALYIFRRKRWQQLIVGALCFLWEPWAILGFVPIFFYNGKKGLSMKYFFYLFYPAHLILLYGILQIYMKMH